MHPDLMLMNCALCNAEVVGPTTPRLVAEFALLDKRLKRFGERVRGRPYCNDCSELNRRLSK